MALAIENPQGTAHFRGDPDPFPVLVENGDAGAGVHQHIIDDLVAVGIDEVGHIRGFGGVDQHLAPGRHPHALGLHANGNLVDDFLVDDVGHGDHVVILVSYIEGAAIGMEDEELRVRPRRKVVFNFQRLGVENRDAVVVTGADENFRSIRVHDNSAGTLAHLHSLHHFQLVEINDGDGIVLFVGDIGRSGLRPGHRQGGQTEGSQDTGPRQHSSHSHTRFHSALRFWWPSYG